MLKTKNEINNRFEIVKITDRQFYERREFHALINTKKPIKSTSYQNVIIFTNHNIILISLWKVFF